MADKKVSQLTALTGANAASGDLLYIVDVSEPLPADQSKKITLTEFQSAPISAGTANAVLYLDGSKVPTSGSGLTYDGTTLAASNFSTGGSVTLSGGTANGVAYLNGSKVLTTGSALTYNGSRLKVTGDVYVNSDTHYLNMLNAADTTWWGRISQSGSDIEFYNRQSGDLKFGVSDTEQMRLTSTGLGIGTSSPSQKLHVVGAIAATGQASALTASSSFYDYILGSNIGRFAVVGDATGTAGSIVLSQYSSNGSVGRDALIIDSSGNLGLGVTPSAWASNFKAIDINGSSGGGAMASASNVPYTVLMTNAYFSSGGSVYKQNGFAGYYLQDMQTSSGGSHAWFTAPSGTAGNTISFTQAMTLDASGRLLLGTTGDFGGATLQVVKANSTGLDANIRVSNNVDTSMMLGTVAANVSGIWSSGAIAFGTNGNTFTERARIDASGNLGLGVTPSAWRTSSDKALQIGSRLALYTDSGITTDLGNNVYINASSQFTYLATAAATRYQQNAGAHTWLTAPSGTAGDAISFSQVMTLDASGNLGVGTTSPSVKLHVSDATNPSIRVTDTTNPTSVDIQAVDGIGYVGTPTDHPLALFTNGTERARITSGGNFKIGGTADRGTTEGDKQLVLFDGTAPVGTLANGVSFYSASGEANVMDAAGNATLLSPHDAETNEWIFRSKHTPTGKVLKIDVERLLKFVNDHFGLDAVHEFIED